MTHLWYTIWHRVFFECAHLFIPNSIHSRHSNQTSQTLHLKNILFPSLSTSHTPCPCPVQRRWYNYSFIYRYYLTFIPNPLLLSTLFSDLHALYPSLCTTSFSHPPSAATCYPRYLKQSTSSNGSLYSIICIRPLFPYLEHLITLLLPTFTLNFLLSHTLPNSFTMQSTEYVFYFQILWISDHCDQVTMSIVSPDHCIVTK